MEVFLSSCKTVRAAEDTTTEVFLDNVRIDPFVEACTGPRGYVVTIKLDKYGTMVVQNNKPVYETKRGVVTAKKPA